ncbi:hypothetical protein [Pusillimonas sp. NJUB218]|uniref:hypothetical protein n=1 Tax=Pusillimonas sp. NJUB218 TaxID=2023230 RepID=UPI0013159BEB|nr:hypothetical protein [Pusillimonas sp. NJUB218]
MSVPSVEVWHGLAEIWERNAAELREYGDELRAEAYYECAQELRAMLKATPEPEVT